MWKRWLFHATDFQSLMYPCFVFYRILGIFPYKINNSFFKASKSLYILSIAIICVCCVLDLIFVYDIIISKTINFGDVTKNLEAICYYVLSGFSDRHACLEQFANAPVINHFGDLFKTTFGIVSKAIQMDR